MLQLDLLNVTIKGMNERQKLILDFAKKNEEFQTKDILIFFE